MVNVKSSKLFGGHISLQIKGAFCVDFRVTTIRRMLTSHAKVIEASLSVRIKMCIMMKDKGDLCTRIIEKQYHHKRCMNWILIAYQTDLF